MLPGYGQSVNWISPKKHWSCNSFSHNRQGQFFRIQRSQTECHLLLCRCLEESQRFHQFLSIQVCREVWLLIRNMAVRMRRNFQVREISGFWLTIGFDCIVCSMVKIEIFKKIGEAWCPQEDVLITRAPFAFTNAGQSFAVKWKRPGWLVENWFS